jgi:hypothetical protein
VTYNFIPTSRDEKKNKSADLSQLRMKQKYQQQTLGLKYESATKKAQWKKYFGLKDVCILSFS